MITDPVKALYWFDVNQYRLVNVLKPKDGDYGTIYYFQTAPSTEAPPFYSNNNLQTGGARQRQSATLSHQ